MSSAVTMFLNQVILTESIPFPIALHQVPSRVNLDTMNQKELNKKLKKSLNAATTDAKTITLEEFIKQRKDN